MRLLPILLLFLSFSAAAQAPAKLPRLCFLALDPDAATSPRFKPFFDGLRDVGLIDGSTITIDIRSTIPIIMHPLIDPVSAPPVAKPADLPVEQPTRFQLVVNQKTAKDLGVKFPDAFMLQVDRVME